MSTKVWCLTDIGDNSTGSPHARQLLCGDAPIRGVFCLLTVRFGRSEAVNFGCQHSRTECYRMQPPLNNAPMLLLGTVELLVAVGENGAATGSCGLI